MRAGERVRPSSAIGGWLLPPQPTPQYPTGMLGDLVASASSVRSPITATGNAVPQLDGTYVELDPSLSADCGGIHIRFPATNSTGVDSSTLLEIATGAGGSEVPWASVGVGYRVDNNNLNFIPGFIPAGTRVAARIRSAISLKAVAVHYTFLPVGAVPVGSPVTFNASTSTSRGLTVTAPGSLNTKGAWTEITATTAARFSQLAVFAQGAGGTAMQGGAGVLVDIGVGASSAETAIVSDIALIGSALEAYQVVSPTTFDVNVPAGSRLVARYARAHANNALDLVVVAA